MSELRDRIAWIIAPVIGKLMGIPQDRYVYDYNLCSKDEQILIYEILSAIIEEIKGIPNPHSHDVHLDHGIYDGLYHRKVEAFRQFIIAKLGEI